MRAHEGDVGRAPEAWPKRSVRESTTCSRSRLALEVAVGAGLVAPAAEPL